MTSQMCRFFCVQAINTFAYRIYTQQVINPSIWGAWNWSSSEDQFQTFPSAFVLTPAIRIFWSSSVQSYQGTESYSLVTLPPSLPPDKASWISPSFKVLNSVATKKKKKHQPKSQYIQKTTYHASVWKKIPI